MADAVHGHFLGNASTTSSCNEAFAHGPGSPLRTEPSAEDVVVWTAFATVMVDRGKDVPHLVRNGNDPRLPDFLDGLVMDERNRLASHIDIRPLNYRRLARSAAARSHEHEQVHERFADACQNRLILLLRHGSALTDFSALEFGNGRRRNQPHLGCPREQRP